MQQGGVFQSNGVYRSIVAKGRLSDAAVSANEELRTS